MQFELIKTEAALARVFPISSFPRGENPEGLAVMQSRGGSRLLLGKTSWTLYDDYAMHDNEKTLPPWRDLLYGIYR